MRQCVASTVLVGKLSVPLESFFVGCAPLLEASSRTIQPKRLATSLELDAEQESAVLGPDPEGYEAGTWRPAGSVPAAWAATFERCVSIRCALGGRRWPVLHPVLHHGAVSDRRARSGRMACPPRPPVSVR